MSEIPLAAPPPAYSPFNGDGGVRMLKTDSTKRPYVMDPPPSYFTSTSTSAVDYLAFNSPETASSSFNNNAADFPSSIITEQPTQSFHTSDDNDDKRKQGSVKNNQPLATICTDCCDCMAPKMVENMMDLLNALCCCLICFGRDGGNGCCANCAECTCCTECARCCAHTDCSCCECGDCC